MSLKMSRKLHQKWDSELVFFEISSLRQNLPRTYYVNTFFGGFLFGLWSSLGASWAALGFLEGLLGGLWTQKHAKPLGFLRFFKGSCLSL